MNVDFDRAELVDVSRAYGRRRAVSRVSLTVRAGDILGLLGPNGAGKSTIIGILSTLVAPTSGHVRYGDQSPRDSGAALRGRIGLLAHELHLYPELTARQNLEFFARLHGVRGGRDGPVELHNLVDGALVSAGLSERGEDVVSGFSRGMRQRLALERALLHNPRLVLLDEPFTGLDDGAVRLVAARLKRLAALGSMVVVATHDLDLADGLVTRVAIVREGRLVTDEPGGAGLRARYRTLVGH